MTLICHILIGCPSSGKSTVANYIKTNYPDSHIISTDQIREELYGNVTIQGNWTEIETEVFKQIHQQLNAKKSIIYDATNAKRIWRIELLQKLSVFKNIHWIGWYLKTPLEVCQHWNTQRSRQVPSEIIERMYRDLKQFPPLSAEGFTMIYEISFRDNCLNLSLISQKLKTFNRNLVNQDNRTQYTLHQYSSLLDFDRLMYLISVIVRYAGIGNLDKTNPVLLKELLGESIYFDTSVEEICAVLSKTIHPIYANSKEITKDLQWLEQNGIMGDCDFSSEIQLETQKDPHLITHPYSDIDPFQRLIKTLRFILHRPLFYDANQGSLESLVNGMKTEGVINYDATDSIRKDIEKVFKPFAILPNKPMKRGYFAGTTILSKTELIDVYRLLETQAKHLDDPLALEVYERFQQRLIQTKLTLPKLYPVRAIYNKAIVDLEQLPHSSLARKIKDIEDAIENGRLLELNRLKGGGRYTDKPDDFFCAYPLQIVFHNIGWYLGYEQEDDKLLRFERLDRLFLGRNQSQTRDRKHQEIALHRLQTLYQASGGIFLGSDAIAQKTYLNPNKRQSVETVLELWFNDAMFRFISEGTKRFPLKQMKLSSRWDHNAQKPTKHLFILPKTLDPRFPNRFQVRLPLWCLEDIDLHRWILGFGGQVKVINPPKLIQMIKDRGNAIADLYS